MGLTRFLARRSSGSVSRPAWPMVSRPVSTEGMQSNYLEPGWPVAGCPDVHLGYTLVWYSDGERLGPRLGTLVAPSAGISQRLHAVQEALRGRIRKRMDGNDQSKKELLVQEQHP